MIIQRLISYSSKLPKYLNMESRTALGNPYYSDDRVILLANFLAEYLVEPGIEIEAKIGNFIFQEEKPDFKQISMIDLQRYRGRFESDISALTFISLMEKLKENSVPFTFIETEDTLYSSKKKNSKIRQTINSNNEVIATIEKSRLADINFLINPTTGLGFRISANTEINLEEIPQESSVSAIRKKARHSFRYQYLELDFTEASMGGKKSFEVELEIADVPFVKNHVDSFLSGKDRNSLLGIANKIWNNVLAMAYHRPKAPLPHIKENEEVLKARNEKYESHWGNTHPVIGDYLYEIILENNFQ
ncbi:unnamed protein product [Blepharisma stoltei]|uniref:mRNA 5'-phosphatase n=1 Tax=Blepharisma stoltei TaxID=1481888 RepID=A0AAU9K2C0_9CILI|nr:unnamed protein product [Blepharisma stoltei]